MISCASTPAVADTPLTAGIILEKMSSEQRSAYVAGVVEGLAYARFQRDGKQEDGLKCIYDWFYKEGGDTARTIYAAFERYPNYPAGVIVWTLMKKKCGE